MAHLLPGKFPEHKRELLMCVVAYYVLTAATFAFSTLFIKDAFLQTRADKAEGLPAMRFQLLMKRHSTTFQLRVSGDGRCGLHAYELLHACCLRCMLPCNCIDMVYSRSRIPRA